MKEYYGTTINFTRPKRSCYRPRRFRSTGALVILFWTFTSFAVLVYPQYFQVEMLTLNGVTIVMLPLTGVLSYTFNSRYKVISCGLRLMCLSIFVYSMLLATKSYINKAIFQAVASTMAVLTAIGLSGTFPSVLSLGIDQLIDARSSDITSYISWIAWTLYLANFLLPVTQNCIPICYSIESPFLSLLLPILCTIAVVLDILLNQWIEKELMTHNPLKLIFQVLKYAASNKYPRLRSSFAIWDEKCSRIDLGKAKYGGPFTAEQVEDVKTFFRIQPVLIVAALFSCTMSILGYSLNTEMFHYQDNNFMSDCSSSVKHYLMNCYERLTILYLPNLVIIVLVPLHECLVYPFLAKHNIDKIKILHKIVLGTLLLLATQIFHFSFEIIGTITNRNNNATCFLQADEGDLVYNTVIQFSYKVLIVPQLFVGLSSYILLTGIMEFICAQSPYSMRGLLFGITFCVCFLPLPVASYLLRQLSKTIKPITTRSCGIWFHTCLGMFTLAVLGVGFCVKQWYSPRQREEHNERRLLISKS